MSKCAILLPFLLLAIFPTSASASGGFGQGGGDPVSLGVGALVLLFFVWIAIKNWKVTAKFVIPYLTIAWIGTEFAKDGEKELGMIVAGILLWVHYKWLFRV